MLQTLSAGLAVSDGQTLSTLRLSQLGNPNLKPEVVTELELGFDLQLFRERVAVEATYFTKQSKDGIGTIQLPPSLGSSAQTLTVNVNSVENRGFELAVDGQAVRTPAFSWNLRLIGSTLQNEVLDLGNQALASAQGITATNRNGGGVSGERVLGAADHRVCRRQRRRDPGGE